MTETEAPTLDNEPTRRRHSLQNGYIPSEKLVVDPSVRFHTGVTEDLDPITYEVIRTKLWNLNVDHSDTIRRVSGSTIVVEGLDFNCAIATEVGDAVTLSPYTMFFAGLADLDIKWTLEHRSMNVGIRDGDLFLQNDPWVGANHQMDTALFGPVFVDGQLFCWLYNCLHQYEIGGIQPGGFIQDAQDVYSEPTFMPPIKLVEEGRIREDIVDMWIRRSRLPELMALELNSQVAGLRTARQRLEDIISRYGAETVKTAMYRMIDNTAKVVGDRLARLPDAVWRDERYFAGAHPDDPKHYRLSMSFEKRGDRLRVSNLGTDAATGSVNLSPGNFRACVLVGLLPTLAYDQQLCAAGVLRQLDFEYAPGAISSASHPSAVSPSMGSVATLNQSHGLGAKMVSGNPELARHAFSSSTLHTMSTNFVTGRTPDGRPMGWTILDMLAGGTGAFNHRDGIDYGPSVSAVAHHFSDVEKFERDTPYLFLYRRELPDAAGHGRFRGGTTYAAAWVGDTDDPLTMSSTGFVKSVSMGIGTAGGLPATGGRVWHAENAGVREAFAAGTVPSGPDALRELAPHGFTPGARADNRLGVDDVFELIANPGAGWGDPLDREPARVARDLAAGRLRPADANGIYGVVTDSDGQVDPAATAELRMTIRRERLSAARPARKPLEGTSPLDPQCPHFIEGVAIVGDEQQSLFA
jgi:N-methylhydantoinase B